MHSYTPNQSDSADWLRSIITSCWMDG